MKIMTVLLLIFAFADSSYGETWTPIQPAGAVPSARSGASMIEIAGTVYLFGGQSEDGMGLLNDLVSYDKDDNKWQEKVVNNPPPVRKNHATFAYNNKMAIVYGEGTSGALNDIWEYDPSANSWTEVPPPQGNVPIARSEHVAVPVAGQYYLFGGKDPYGKPLDDLWKYEPRANAWAKIAASSPKALYGHKAVVVDTTKLYVLGGTDGQTRSQDIFCYDTIAKNWTVVTPATSAIPPARAFHIVGYNETDKKIIISGGKNGALQLDDTWEFDLQTRIWTQKAKGPSLSESAAVTYNNGRMLVFGGKENGVAVNKMWIYDPNGQPPRKPGDLDGDGDNDLADVIIGLRVNVNLNPAELKEGWISVDGSNKIGPETNIYNLQVVAEFR